MHQNNSFNIYLEAVCITIFLRFTSYRIENKYQRFRFITPLTIGPSVAMIGLSLFDVASLNASKHWGVTIG